MFAKLHNYKDSRSRSTPLKQSAKPRPTSSLLNFRDRMYEKLAREKSHSQLSHFKLNGQPATFYNPIQNNQGKNLMMFIKQLYEPKKPVEQPPEPQSRPFSGKVINVPSSQQWKKQPTSSVYTPMGLHAESSKVIDITGEASKEILVEQL